MQLAIFQAVVALVCAVWVIPGAIGAAGVYPERPIKKRVSPGEDNPLGRSFCGAFVMFFNLRSLSHASPTNS